MRKIYKTMKGRSFDMELFSRENGKTRAIGNTNMNARGDILGKLNEVKIPREKILVHPNRVKRDNVSQVSLKDTLAPDNFDTPAQVIEKVNKTKRRDTSGMLDKPKNIATDEKRENKKKKLK